MICWIGTKAASDSDNPAGNAVVGSIGGYSGAAEVGKGRAVVGGGRGGNADRGIVGGSAGQDQTTPAVNAAGETRDE